jgi:hypothetical protein
MAATTPVAFDPAPIHLGLTMTFKAGSAILSGQIVAFADSGDSRKVVPATSSVGAPIGVAAHSQATTGGDVTVLMQGCVCKVMLSADDGTADAGDWIGVSTVAGTGIVRDPAIQAHDTIVGLQNAIGLALDDIAAGAATVGGTGYILIQTSCPVCAAS